MTISSDGRKDGKGGDRNNQNINGSNKNTRTVSSNNEKKGNKNHKINRDNQDFDAGGRDDTPSAPSPGLVLFNSEDQADMIFNVGIDASDIWRIPAHSFVVSGASPVFQAIIDSRQGSLGINFKEGDKKPEFSIYCQPELFHLMLRYVFVSFKF